MTEHVEETIVDNEVYDLIKATATKLEGLAAYNKYELNGQANAQVWRELREQDEQAVRRLLAQLEQFARDGRLTAR
jgi:hypothetical protein